ncbi:MAG TPA: hypothetical protein VK550_18655 [Polyangiaceae bacterium]|jgi:hypothetical protein|nr:hypothetical protein [Polyangiaceae bacterium]
MVSNYWRIVSLPVLLTALASPLLIDCGKMPSVPGAPNVPGVPGAPGNCPDMANVDAVANFDWQKEFKLDASAAGKLKGGLAAAINLKGLAVEIDGDLKSACGNLAKDLGASGDFADGKAACDAAIKAMGDARAKMGANAKANLAVTPPHCSASMDAMADCAGKCDASVQGGKAEVKCEKGELSGSCDAKCEGKCELTAAATCDGTCEGSCDAHFTGKCEGTCNGKCDGKDSKGSCAGKCDGSCDAGGKGDCKGKCGGSCQLKGAAKCDGQCTGKCSVEMKAPKCTGEVTPPKVSAECKASCDAKVNGKLECTPAKVALNVTGAADASVATKYKGAIEKNLPAILKIAIGMKDRVASITGSVEGVIDGAQGTVKAAASGSPVTGAALTACVANPFKGAMDAAASIKANVNVSVDVKASASASGSASGKAG